jgi:hypothetical protein
LMKKMSVHKHETDPLPLDFSTQNFWDHWSTNWSSHRASGPPFGHAGGACIDLIPSRLPGFCIRYISRSITVCYLSGHMCQLPVISTLLSTRDAPVDLQTCFAKSNIVLCKLYCFMMLLFCSERPCYARLYMHW